MAKYSNMQAMGALIKASLLSIVKSPSAIVFTIAFPLIFILIFGSMGKEGRFSIQIAAAPGSDTTNDLYGILQQVPVLKWVKKDSASINKMLKEGDLVGTVAIQHNAPGVKPEYAIMLHTASTEADKAQQLKAVLQSIIQSADPEIQKRQAELVSIESRVSEVREYSAIDFILPGQLGFSLLASGVFGTAFIFYSLRQTLVLKRFFATPVRKQTIVVSEGISRMLFQIVGTIIIIGVGHYVFGFTLAKGWLTFIELLSMSALALLIFMGFGFIVSSLAKSEAVIPLFANIIVMPQLLLSGTFFSISNFPIWLQYLCNALPLTYLNHALRKISYEGASLWDVRKDILILMGIGVVIYAIAGKVFKWE